MKTKLMKIGMVVTLLLFILAGNSWAHKQKRHRQPKNHHITVEYKWSKYPRYREKKHYRSHRQWRHFAKPFKHRHYRRNYRHHRFHRHYYHYDDRFHLHRYH